MDKRVLVPIADGTEEIEAVTIIDVLRRAETEVTVASVGELQVTASRGVKLVADAVIADCRRTQYDAIALPGGKAGAERLRDSADLAEILKSHREQDRWLAAICAAPALVLQSHGLLKKCRATCHPDFVHLLDNADAAGARVVVDGKCLTSRGPGTALDFALKLVEVLYGGARTREVAVPMVISGYGS
jgi:4-methyl-5(b-hydroxyethyl)-thiazole monophosphate biosynthesis